MSSCSHRCCLLLQPGTHYTHSCWSGDLSRRNGRIRRGSNVCAAFAREAWSFSRSLGTVRSPWNRDCRLFVYHACLDLNPLTPYSVLLSTVTRGSFGKNLLIGVKRNHVKWNISHTLSSPAFETRGVFLAVCACSKSEECSSSAFSWGGDACRPGAFPCFLLMQEEVGCTCAPQQHVSSQTCPAVLWKVYYGWHITNPL